MVGVSTVRRGLDGPLRVGAACRAAALAAAAADGRVHGATIGVEF